MFLLNIFTVMSKCQIIVEKLVSEAIDDVRCFMHFKTFPRRQSKRPSLFPMSIEVESICCQVDSPIKQNKPFAALDRRRGHHEDAGDGFSTLAWRRAFRLHVRSSQ